MIKQQTLDSQTATFIGLLLRKLPELTTNQKQYFIEHSGELERLLSCLQPTMEIYLKRYEWSKLTELIELLPSSDLRILRMRHYPDLGILVSNRHNTCGEGLRLALPGEGDSDEPFRAPCGCCNWAGQFSGSREQEAGIRAKAVEAIRATCSEKNIRTLLFHDWEKVMRQDIESLHLVDPYHSSAMKELDHKLRLAFGWLKVYVGNETFPFHSLYEK